MKSAITRNRELFKKLDTSEISEIAKIMKDEGYSKSDIVTSYEVLCGYPKKLARKVVNQKI